MSFPHPLGVPAASGVACLAVRYRYHGEYWHGGLCGVAAAGQGYGDPKLGIERFVALLRGLRQRGVREIAGDLVLDRGHFAIDLPFPSNFDDDPYAPYNAPPDALLLNLKAVQLSLGPDRGGVSVVADPKPAGVRVINHCPRCQH